MTALLLLAPGTPMLFQGQEFAASAPFFYFADHDPELAAAGPQGPRRSSWRSSPAWRRREAGATFADPATRPRSSAASSTSPSGIDHAGSYALHRDLLRLRRDDRRAFRAEPIARRRRRGASAAGVRAALLRRRGRRSLLLVNLGRDLRLRAGPRAAAGAAGRLRLAARVVERRSACYGGCGTADVRDDRWHCRRMAPSRDDRGRLAAAASRSA